MPCLSHSRLGFKASAKSKCVIGEHTVQWSESWAFTAVLRTLASGRIPAGQLIITFVVVVRYDNGCFGWLRLWSEWPAAWETLTVAAQDWLALSLCHAQQLSRMSPAKGSPHTMLAFSNGLAKHSRWSRVSADVCMPSNLPDEACQQADLQNASRPLALAC